MSCFMTTVCCLVTKIPAPFVIFNQGLPVKYCSSQIFRVYSYLVYPEGLIPPSGGLFHYLRYSVFSIHGCCCCYYYYKIVLQPTANFSHRKKVSLTVPGSKQHTCNNYLHTTIPYPFTFPKLKSSRISE